MITLKDIKVQNIHQAYWYLSLQSDLPISSPADEERIGILRNYWLFDAFFVTRVTNYKLPMFSEDYYCIVEAQYTYMEFKKQ